MESTDHGGEGIELAELSNGTRFRPTSHPRNSSGKRDEANGPEGEADDDDGGGGDARDDDPEGEQPLLEDPGVRAERRARRARVRKAKSSRLRRRLRLLWKALVALLFLGTILSGIASIIFTVELKRHLGRLMFACLVAVHFLLDSIAALLPLLCARTDGESIAPPPIPRTQVEFQRQLRSGIPLFRARDGADGCGCDEAWRFRVSRGIAVGIVLVYVVVDMGSSAWMALVLSKVATVFAVDADGTVVKEWRGMHTALMALTATKALAVVVRTLTIAGAGAYLWSRSQLRATLRGREPPWHPVMSGVMESLALRQANAFVIASGVLLAATIWSFMLHSDFIIHTSSPKHYDQCDPLDETLCALPFPSSFFLKEGSAVGWDGDGLERTGLRVNFGPRSLPFTLGRDNVPIAGLNRLDGFSPLAPILFYLEGMSKEGLPGPQDIGASLFPNSTTWLLEADSGRMVPHFTELDAVEPSSTLAILQPAEPLRHRTRYIVAVCGAVGEVAGELLQPTPGFRELVEASRANRAAKVRRDLRSRANRFSREIFPRLHEVLKLQGTNGGADDDILGLGLGDIQLAWDFVTASEESQLGTIRAMQERSRSWLDANIQLNPVGKGNGSESGTHAGVGEGGEVGDAVDDDIGDTRGNGRGLRSWSLVNPWGDDASRGERSSTRGRSASSSGPGTARALHSEPGEARRRSSWISPMWSELSRSLRFGGGEAWGRAGISSRFDQRRRPMGRRGLSERGEEDPSPPTRGTARPSGTASSSVYRVVDIDVEAKDSEDPIARRVWARMRVPAFTSPFARGAGFVNDPNDAGVKGGRESDGSGAFVGKAGTMEVGFSVNVPRSVASGEHAPEAIVLFGHGLFGDRFEMEDDYVRTMAESGLWVMVGVDWRGMSTNDLPVMARALMADPGLLFSEIPLEIAQGFVNMEAVLTLVSRRLDEFVGDEGAARIGDPTKVPLMFYGVSQGAILGAGYTEFSSLVTRSVLVSGGTPFSFLIGRSSDFSTYKWLLEFNFAQWRHIRLLLSLLQMTWDGVEAAGWLAGRPEGPGGGRGGDAENSRSKAVLIQGATGDSEVSIIGTQILARAYKAKAVDPPPVDTWGVPSDGGSASCEEDKGSVGCCGASGGASLALIEYVEDEDQVPDDNTAPAHRDVHLCVRLEMAFMAQTVRFVRSGCPVNFCEGVCRFPQCHV